MSEYVRIKNADQDLMTDVIQQARGFRGYSDFANDCGTTYRSLMRVVRKEFLLPYYPENVVRSIAQHKDASVDMDEESFLAVNGEIKKTYLDALLRKSWINSMENKKDDKPLFFCSLDAKGNLSANTVYQPDAEWLDEDDKECLTDADKEADEYVGFIMKFMYLCRDLSKIHVKFAFANARRLFKDSFFCTMLDEYYGASAMDYDIIMENAMMDEDFMGKTNELKKKKDMADRCRKLLLNYIFNGGKI